ncbi:opioid growth factor receptor conserved region-domain-containing protein [Trametes gibbosa]|nr:opioid growth factor receptor conserved region-domain-containing protein [Trametes gibbosa]
MPRAFPMLRGLRSCPTAGHSKSLTRLAVSHPPRRVISTMSLPADVREFLEGYPGAENDHRLTANLGFYTNNLRCKPDNLLINELHEQWKADYEKLEYKHGYIQWLFPLQEHGLNFQAQPLQKHELVTLKADPHALERLHRSYTIMLGFYGMQLVSTETGELRRAENWKERYRNLARAPHNNLRISRILKCLSEFGLERLNAAFLLFVLAEQSEHGQLNTQTIRSSMDRWWANCLRNEEERAWVNDVIRKARTQEDFVLTEEAYREALQRRKATGSFSNAGNEAR